MPLSTTITAVERIASAHRAAAVPVLHEVGLSETQGALLWALGGSITSDLTMSEAAAALSCDASNLTLLARHLESLDLAERIPDPADARRRRLTLTQHGREVVERMTRALDDASPLRALTDAERATLDELLAKAMDHAAASKDDNY
ncbi:DNA-binding MarR family transcriptional regulator [Microbacteriaceae bacterium SG_E_30_P1]|uniref:DNA-binding MarR family transcriptional regulator n=1 Tax=Antiquaquibacter oligotrophicus TaxID=2880260 RepID=A0ABT6KS02_9MICO|nr:MarR family transcriptional regulator [Antiquaquibacter oligotrophicus]MDH6182575.1 DNA-binding MarR family transcriptional regulator [Antiquaquibacter oligotrophicus]UDF14458.1 MarR family transcriptional regulator [Antiquaquibacter oligotrophicus]